MKIRNRFLFRLSKNVALALHLILWVIVPSCCLEAGFKSSKFGFKKAEVKKTVHHEPLVASALQELSSVFDRFAKQLKKGKNLHSAPSNTRPLPIPILLPLRLPPEPTLTDPHALKALASIREIFKNSEAQLSDFIKYQNRVNNLLKNYKDNQVVSAFYNFTAKYALLEYIQRELNSSVLAYGSENLSTKQIGKAVEKIAEKMIRPNIYENVAEAAQALRTPFDAALKGYKSLVSSGKMLSVAQFSGNIKKWEEAEARYEQALLRYIVTSAVLQELAQGKKIGPKILKLVQRVVLNKEISVEAVNKEILHQKGPELPPRPAKKPLAPLPEVPLRLPPIPSLKGPGSSQARDLIQFIRTLFVSTNAQLSSFAHYETELKEFKKIPEIPHDVKELYEFVGAYAKLDYIQRELKKSLDIQKDFERAVIAAAHTLNSSVNYKNAQKAGHALLEVFEPALSHYETLLSSLSLLHVTPLKQIYELNQEKYKVTLEGLKDVVARKKVPPTLIDKEEQQGEFIFPPPPPLTPPPSHSSSKKTSSVKTLQEEILERRAKIKDMEQTIKDFEKNLQKESAQKGQAPDATAILTAAQDPKVQQFLENSERKWEEDKKENLSPIEQDEWDDEAIATGLSKDDFFSQPSSGPAGPQDLGSVVDDD